MKDVVSISKSGKTFGFTINPGILGELKLKIGDMVEVELFIEYKSNPSVIITRRLRKIGGSVGISIRRNLVDDLKLTKGDSIQVDIRKPEIV